MKLVENDSLKYYWDLETGHVTLGRQLFFLCPPWLHDCAFSTHPPHPKSRVGTDSDTSIEIHVWSETFQTSLSHDPVLTPVIFSWQTYHAKQLLWSSLGLNFSCVTRKVTSKFSLHSKCSHTNKLKNIFPIIVVHITTYLSIDFLFSPQFSHIQQPRISFLVWGICLLSEYRYMYFHLTNLQKVATTFVSRDHWLFDVLPSRMHQYLQQQEWNQD